MIPGALPGLEEQAILGTPGAKNERTRMRLGARLASRILGRKVQLVRAGESWEFVDPDSGEIVSHLGGRERFFSALLMRASLPCNHLVGVMTHKPKAGQSKAFLGGTAAWKSSLRLDPNWMTAMRARSRHRAEIEVARMIAQLPKREKKLRDKKVWHRKEKKWILSPDALTEKFLTLTQPHRPGADTVEQLTVFNLAFQALRKKDLWTSTVYGAVKAAEDALDPDGPHVHGHFYLLSRFIVWEDWRKAWCESLDYAWRKQYGEGLPPGLMPVIDVRLIVKKTRPGERELRANISRSSALDEISKYITKTSDLLKTYPDGRQISPDILLSQCEIARWPRMFELIGMARNRGAKRVGTHVHTSCISVAESFRDALTQAREMEEGPAPEPSPIERSWKREYSYRKVIREDGTIVMEREDPGDRDALHWQWDHGSSAYQAKQRTRPATWRELMDQLNFSDWLHLMMGRAEAGQKFRLKQIADKNPTCLLVDLNGRCVLKQQPED